MSMSTIPKWIIEQFSFVFYSQAIGKRGSLTIFIFICLVELGAESIKINRVRLGRLKDTTDVLSKLSLYERSARLENTADIPPDIFQIMSTVHSFSVNNHITDDTMVNKCKESKRVMTPRCINRRIT